MIAVCLPPAMLNLQGLARLNTLHMHPSSVDTTPAILFSQIEFKLSFSLLFFRARRKIYKVYDFVRTYLAKSKSVFKSTRANRICRRVSLIYINFRPRLFRSQRRRHWRHRFCETQKKTNWLTFSLDVVA